MRPFFIVFISSLLLTACQKQPEVRSEFQSNSHVMFYGGDIVSASNVSSQVEAILIVDGRVAKAGSYEEVSRLATNAHKIDLMGSTIVPGFIDSHVHVRELGTDAVKADVVGMTTTTQMVASLKEKFPNPEPGVWLLGQGWDEGAFASAGYPDRAELDLAFPNNPVLLESLHGFANFSNGKALEIAGVNVDTVNPDAGKILRREDGTPTGVMLTLAQALVSKMVPPFSQAQIEEAIVAGLKTMAKAGVTSVHEAGMTPVDVAAYNALAERNQLPIRVYGLLNGNDKKLMDEWFARGILEREDQMFTVRSIKVYYDGSLGSRTAMLREPYSDHPEKAHPTERISPASVTLLANQAAVKGFQMAVHAIGDEGNDRTLNIYESALSDQPQSDTKQDHRWRIEHAQVVLDDYFLRTAKAGFISSMQSSHAVGDSKWAEDRIGPVRIHNAYAWQKVLAAGGRLIINSDLPGEPWQPMETLYFAVNRTRLDGTPADGWYPDQALTVSEALHAMTLEGAYSAFQEKDLGSLEVGKFADFVILDQNPLQTNSSALADIQVLSTWVAGKQVQ